MNTTPNHAPSVSRNRFTLLLIAGTFVLPICIAWLMTSGALRWQPHSLLNHGTLINPPVALAKLPAGIASSPLRALPPADWALLYISAGACDLACSKALNELAAIRMLVGNEGTRVSVFGLLGMPTDQAPVGAHLLVDPKLVDGLRVQLVARNPSLQVPLIGFLDWRGQLMMQFSPSAPPADIKADLARLLRASAIK